MALIICRVWNEQSASGFSVRFGLGTMLANFHMCGIMLVLEQFSREKCESKRAYVF